MAALDKDPAILAVLDRLWSRFGPSAFVLVDHWESDLCAVGIASPRDPGVLVYISSYGEPPGRFGYELELPPPPGDDFPYQVAGTGSDVSFEELAGVVAGHLKHAEPGAAELDRSAEGSPMGRHAVRVAFVAAAIAVGSCSRPATPPPPAPVQIGGDYGPVTAERLRGKHSVFATGITVAKFLWEFTGDRFKVTGDGGPIPEDATVTFLGERQPAVVIEGRWALADRALTLTGVTADGKSGYKDITLHPFQTPVVRVDLAGTQYVFRPLQ